MHTPSIRMHSRPGQRKLRVAPCLLSSHPCANEGALTPAWSSPSAAFALKSCKKSPPFVVPSHQSLVGEQLEQCLVAEEKEAAMQAVHFVALSSLQQSLGNNMMQVLESWRLVLRGLPMEITLEDVRVCVRDSAAFVTCTEVMEAGDSRGRYGLLSVSKTCRLGAQSSVSAIPRPAVLHAGVGGGLPGSLHSMQLIPCRSPDRR